MQKLLRRLYPWALNWKRILIESCLMLLAYVVWLSLRSPTSVSRSLIGSLAILVPVATAALLTFLARPLLPGPARWSWLFWGFAFTLWAAGNFVRTYYQVMLPVPLPKFSLADIFNFLAYPFVLLALVFYPSRNRFVPSRFRFIFDAAISSGVVAVLGWLVIARPAVQSNPGSLASLLPLVYPVADLVLLMILFNTLLASSLTRRTSLLLGLTLLLFLVSDYIYSYQVLIQAFQVGSFASLGWTVGGLVFGLAVALESAFPSSRPPEEQPQKWSPDPAARLQNILPIVLVITLIWFILADWRLRGELSLPGLWMTLILSLALIIRLGVRAGEMELYKYWQLFANLAEPTFICDVKGKILLANPALLRELNLPENQPITQPLADFFGGQAFGQDLLDRAALSPVSLEVHLLSSGAPHLLSLSPIFTEERKPLIAGVAYDIREQKDQQRALEKAYQDLQAVSKRLEELNTQLEEKVAERTRVLQEAYQQLEEQNRMLQALDQLKSDFVSMVSHELRTPLTSLHGGLELLLARPGRRPEDRDAMQLMKSEVQRLAHFVENVLDLSALEAGRLVVHLEPVDLSLVVKDVLWTLTGIPGADRIQTSLPPDAPMVLADENFLHSVLSQLLDNALKYAPDGPVLVDALMVRNRIRVRVTDRGSGIPPEKLHLLFTRFQRLEARDSQSVYGYGLGLYLSRQLMLAQKSDLSYETPADGGACFYFDLKVLK
jgi:signal transduction histidine kinase